MTADSIALMIAGATGFLAGSTVGIVLAGIYLAGIRRRAEKTTWAAASRFYTRLESTKS